MDKFISVPFIKSEFFGVSRDVKRFSRCEEIHDPYFQEKFTVVKEFAVGQNRKVAVPTKSFRWVILDMKF
jgi:hypothetical protein